jgi:hypothetical protein
MEKTMAKYSRASIAAKVNPLVFSLETIAVVVRQWNPHERVLGELLAWIHLIGTLRRQQFIFFEATA